MLVYVDTARVVTQKAFRSREDAAKFANTYAKTIVSIRHEHGRIIVKYHAKAAAKVWSRNREESGKRTPTYKLAPENWPAKYR
ncbi:MAG: hypothetical protein H0U60_19670 [Blastocatellia bacterium]|nr:hypothetical protein [Blastocatellia bacterium]